MSILYPFPFGFAGTGPPSEVAVTIVIVGTTATVTWTASLGADSYDVSVSVDLGEELGVVSYPASVDPREHVVTDLPEDSLIFAEVTARNMAGSTPSDSDSAVTVPAAVADVDAVATAYNKISVSWGDLLLGDGNTYETGYKVYNAATDALVATVAADATSALVTGLTAETAYCFYVVGYNGAGDGSPSAQACATTPVQTPDEPTIDAFDGSTCSAGSATYMAGISVGDSTSDTAWTGHIERKPTGTDDSFYAALSPALTWTPNGGSHTLYDETAEYLGHYTYRAIYRNGVNSSPFLEDSVIILQPCFAPGSFTLSVTPGSTTAALSWTASSDALGYNVYRGGTLLTSVGSGTTTYGDSGLTPGVSYSWHIEASNDGGSTSSNTVTKRALPSAPTSVSASADTTSAITVTWTCTDPGVTGFNIKRRRTSDGAETIQAVGPLDPVSPGSDTRHYQWTGLSEETNYCFSVQTINDEGTSSYSGESCATTLDAVPGAPSSLSFSSLSTCSGGVATFGIRVSWTDYFSETDWTTVIQRTPTGTGLWATIASQTPGGGTQHYDDYDVEELNHFDYRVFYTRSGYSDSSDVSGTASTVTQPCSVPGAFTLSGNMDELTAELSWTASSNHAGYHIKRAGSTVDTVSAATTSWSSATGNSADQSVTYAVEAYGDGGTHSESVTLYTLPNVPTNLRSGGVTTSSATIKWGPDDFSDGNTYETGYQVFNFTLGTYSSWLPADTKSYTWSGLSSGTAYTFYVLAKNAAGTTANSSSLILTTSASAPSAPASVSATDTSHSGIPEATVSWTNTTTDTAWTLRIDRSPSGFDIWAEVAALTPSGSTQNYVDDGVEELHDYDYRLRYTHATASPSGYGTTSVSIGFS